VVRGTKSVLTRFRNFLSSFSFRAGTLIFISFCALLLSTRVLLYHQAINTTRNDIKEIVLAHAQYLQQSFERYGLAYVKEYINAVLEETQDKHLILAMRDKKGHITGNLKEWPTVKKDTAGWVEFALPRDNEDPLNITANIANYKGINLLVGYDLTRLEIMEKALWLALMQNALLSFIAALLLTFLVIFLLNKNMQKLNRTCTEVTFGNSKHRVKLSGANDEFERLGKNLNAMLDRNEALLDTIRDSTNALAHDMRTPLSRLRIKLQSIIEQTNLTHDVQEGVASAVLQTDVLVEMFDNILSIAKAESRIETQIFIDFNMSDVLSNIIDFYATFVEDKEQTLEIDIPEKTIFFRGDRQLVSQAMLNLLDNAVKYTPKKGSVKVSLTSDSEFIICTFADSGPGIPPEFREKVKERFFRMDVSRNTEGTGLGMSLVDAVAKLHNGRLELDDNNPGLKVSLIFPKEPLAGI
jgi:signal transduction histidine kinase